MPRPSHRRAADAKAGPGDAAALDERTAERVADTMFALSTPSRVLILGHLLEGPRSVGELTDALGMEQSAVSHQLRVLREHQLVRVLERVGRRRVYGLHDDHVRALLDEALRHVGHRKPESTSRRSAAKG